MIDLHIGATCDEIVLWSSRLIGEQRADGRKSSSLGQFPHQTCADQTAAQSRRRLGEHKVVLVGRFKMSRNNRIASGLN